MNLPDFSIKRPVFISMIFLSITLFGIIAARLLPVEMMPNINFGHITIYIDVRGGLPADDVEKLIAKPVEEAVSDVSHLKNILAISKEGNATIILEFKEGTNMDFASLEVREKFNRVRNKLPKEVEKPVIAKYEYNDVPIMIVAATSNTLTPEDIRKIVDEKIKPKLQRIEGVARVELAGGRESKILIEIDKYRLQSLSLPIQAVIEAINQNNVNRLVGEIKRSRDKFLVRTIGELKDFGDIANLALITTKDGSTVRIGDVAKIEDSYLEPHSLARVNSQPAVSMYIQKESLANTVKVATMLEKQIQEIKKTLKDDIQITIVSNQADYIRKSIQSVRQSLYMGAALAFAILFLFLRAPSVVSTIGFSIPLSILGTFFLMRLVNLSINLMTLSGLALGVGMLVDNSIVVIESFYRKVEQFVKSLFNKQNQTEEKSVTTTFAIPSYVQRTLAAEGAKEIQLAIFASTLTTLAVFLPLVFIDPGIRMLYSGMALTICFALVTSLFCALTLVPMIISRLKIKVKSSSGKDRIQSVYTIILTHILHFRYLLIIIIGAIFIATLHQWGKLEKEFIGVAEQNKFTTFIEMPTGTRLDVTDRVVKEVEKFIARLPEVKNVQSRIEPWSSKIYVTLKPLKERKISTSEVINKIRPFTKKFPNAFIYFEEPQEVGTKEILVDIYGYDYDVLKGLAIKIGQRIQAIPRFTDAKIRMREGRPEVIIKVDKTRAAMLGLTTQDIAETLHAQFRGLVATRYRGLRGEAVIKLSSARPLSSLDTDSLLDGERAHELETIVRLEEDFRRTIEDLRKATLVSPDGETIYLSQLATFSFSLAPSEIWRKNKQRMVQVSANTGGMPLGTAAEKVKKALADLKMPKDYFWKIGGNYEKMIQNQKALLFAVFLSIIIIYMILASLFESFSQPFIIMVTVPLATIGAVWSLKFTSKPLSMGAMIGIIMLGGIIVNNAIILVDRINFLKKKKHLKESFELVVRAATDRVRPIIMTSLTTIASMLFLAFDTSESSNLWSPLAITVIGGMTVGSVLTLFVVPSLYLVIEDFRRFFK